MDARPILYGSIFPHLICILGLKEIMEEMDRLLQLNEVGQLLSYDTTFNLGDFVSLPIFRNVIFEKTLHSCSIFDSREQAERHTRKIL